MLNILITYWPILVWGFIAAAAGYQSSAIARKRAECATNGHQWVPAGLGDHPDAAVVCSHCGLEW